MTGAVDGVAGGLLGVAHYAVIDVGGLDAGALYGFDGGDGAQLLGGEVAKFSTVAPHGRAGAVDNSDSNCIRHMYGE